MRFGPNALLCLAVWALVAPAPASGFSGSIHSSITRNAFPFMAGSPLVGSGVRSTIVAGNLDEDQDAAENLAERHGQNCRFRDSARYINMRYRQVIDALREPWPNDPNRAPRLFGHILHGLQDFYSHSNWIPTPPQGLGLRGRLLDQGLGEWKIPEPYSVLFDDVAVVEGDPPAGVTARLPTDAAGKISGAVPIVEDRRLSETVTAKKSPAPRAGSKVLRGLMTSGAPRHPGDQLCPIVAEKCDVATPENVCLRHGEGRDSDTSSRNFDGVGRMNLDGSGGGDWFQARHHAKLQSRHEWCRLLHLSRDFDPSFVASGRLLGTWVTTDSGDSTPHVPGTPCERGAARRHLVEITATPGDKAPSQVPFVLFRSDFTSSARARVSRNGSKTLKICGDTDEKIVATLVPPRTGGVTFVVPVPGTAKAWTVRDHRGAFDATFAVKVTPNAC